MEGNNLSKFTAIDLFSGAGGLSKGFLDAGFDVALGIDFDDSALRTFEKNHGKARALKLDLYNLENIDVIVKEFNKKNKTLDVLIGGPPCQGFSLAGKREEDDERNMLYKAMVKLAERMKPRAIVLENVPGMLTLYNGAGRTRIFNDFENLGYNMSVDVLYAPEYGVPQIRKRAFFVGLLDSNTKFEFPKPILTSDEFITCEDAIGDLPELNGIYGDDIQEYECEPKTNYQAEMRKNSSKIYKNDNRLGKYDLASFLRAARILLRISCWFAADSTDSASLISANICVPTIFTLEGFVVVCINK